MDQSKAEYKSIPPDKATSFIANPIEVENVKNSENFTFIIQK